MGTPHSASPHRAKYYMATEPLVKSAVLYMLVSYSRHCMYHKTLVKKKGGILYNVKFIVESLCIG